LIAALIQSGENAIWPGGSIYPAVWSLQLAARAHGLGSVPVGSLARHQAEIFPRLGVPGGSGSGRHGRSRNRSGSMLPR